MADVPGYDGCMIMMLYEYWMILLFFVHASDGILGITLDITPIQTSFESFCNQAQYPFETLQVNGFFRESGHARATAGGKMCGRGAL